MQKNNIIIFSAILCCLIFVTGCTKQQSQLTDKPKNDNNRTESPQQKLCETGGGIWKQFSNGGKFCHDECSKPDNIRCTKSFSWGCDCPDQDKRQRCWDGKSCIDNN